MEGDKQQITKTFLEVTNIYLHITFELGIWKHGIYMQFALKWNQTMQCLDNFYIFKKMFNNATDAASSTGHKKFVQHLGIASLAFLVFLYPYQHKM